MGKPHDIVPGEEDRCDMGNAHDVEKYEYFERGASDEYDHNNIPFSYPNSPRESSGSYQPMLPKVPSRSSQPVRFYRPPGRKTIRYLCLALFTTLVIFILSLIRASYQSSRQLEMGPVEKQTTAKPPPWEDFPFLKRYFGGIRSLVRREENIPEYPSDEPVAEPSNSTVRRRDNPRVPTSSPFDPYPDFTSLEYTSGYRKKHECYLDSNDHVRIPQVHGYAGIPRGMPDAVMGSSNVLGLRDDVCFERFGRLGPYGYGYSVKKGGTGVGMNGEREGAEDMWSEDGSVPQVDYTKVKWSEAQNECLLKNKERFTAATQSGQGREHLFANVGQRSEQDKLADAHLRRRENSTTPLNRPKDEHAEGQHRITLLPRSAVIIRTWWDHQYSLEDIVYLRSMIAELSLLSGGEYAIHFLVHVKDDNVPIWADKQIYDRVLENSLPEEFRGMGSLWSERQMSLIYGGLEETFFRNLPVHGVYRGLYMALQYFSNQHPEYEYLWNWEMDVRYTGHWYHLFDRVQSWSRDQPRKGLWERNGRFYVPSVHGDWEDFKQMIRVQSEMGMDNPNNVWSGLKAGGANIPGLSQGKTDSPVWGPESPPDMLEHQDDPTPPTPAEKDKYEWGVGEEPDLITFSPLFDPDGTTWFYVGDVTGYNTTEALPPRRAAIGTSSRLSRRLLQTMHRETILKRHHMFTEMWPASIALHHGLKAVYAPHPVYIDRRWPTAYLAGVMNGGRNGASGGARTSVYGGREHNFKGTTWFYDAGFSPNLWRRWLGYKVDNDGGEQEELANEGRICLPAMLLHPVKGVKLVVEGGETIEEQELEKQEKVEDAELDWERAEQ